MGSFNNKDKHDAINKMLDSLARLEFSHRIETDASNAPMDQISLRLNTIGEELEANIIDKSILKEKNNELINALKESAYYKYALDQSAIVVITDTKGTIEYVNDKFCEISKYSKEQLIGQNQSIVNSSHHDIHFWKDMWKTIGKGNVWRNEIKNKAKDHSYYWVDTTIIPFIGENKKVEKYLAIRFDVTAQKKNLELLEEKHKESLRYQIKLLATQLNPNFIYSSMNSLQFWILDENIEAALTFSATFSDLIRSVIQNSQHLYISLEEEITFLEKFLKMEQERNKNTFDYDIYVEDLNIEEDYLPPMIIQPFVENSILHGVSKLNMGGKIEIHFSTTDDALVCVVQDNGLGRDKAIDSKETRSGSVLRPDGMGLSENRLKLYTELVDQEFSISITDKKNEKGNSLGTMVKIIIPKKLIQEDSF